MRILWQQVLNYLGQGGEWKITHSKQFTIYLSGVVGSYEHGVDVLSHKNSVIYIDTELKFDPNRLVQIALERYPEIYSSEFRSDSAHQVDRLLTAVKVGW